MSNYYLKPLMGLIVLVSLLTACASPKKENQKKFGEPNNSILSASLLKSGKGYTMKIDSIGDVDWYALPVSGSGYVRITTKTVPENLNLEVRFAEKQAWEPEKQKWLSDWERIPKTIGVADRDTLYFAIIDDWNDKASPEVIEFKADFIAEFSDNEPNNKPENAVTVKSGVVMETSFFPKTDIDWFKITVDSAGYLMIHARKVPEEIKINARYARQKSDFGKVECIKDWQKLPAGIQVTTPGTYYFSLLDDWNDAMSREKAEWKITYLPEMDTTEPNNSFKEAYPVSVGDTLKTAIFPKGDNDYFTLTPDSTFTLRLAVEKPENLGIDARLYVKDGFEVNTLGDWKGLPAKFELEGGKQYFLQIHDGWDDAYSQDPVSLLFLK